MRLSPPLASAGNAVRSVSWPRAAGRAAMLVLGLAWLAACEPKTPDAKKAPELTAEEKFAEETGNDEIYFKPDAHAFDDEEGAGLALQEFPNAPAFRVVCTRTKEIHVFADGNQIGEIKPAGDGQFIAAGTPFPGTYTADAEIPQIVTLKTPLTPESLAAIRDSVTVRLGIGDAFAESMVDPGGKFKDLAERCTKLTGVVAK